MKGRKKIGFSINFYVKINLRHFYSFFFYLSRFILIHFVFEIYSGGWWGWLEENKTNGLY